MQLNIKIGVILATGVAGYFSAIPAQAQSVVAMSGQIQGIPAPASVGKSGIQSDTMIMAFQERQSIVLSEPLAINISQPGDYSSESFNATGTIATGRIVNSCMLESNNVNATYSHPTTYNASITFKTEILGIIVLSSRLDETDSLLGARNTTYPFHRVARGLEKDDALSLSSDRRTVKVHFATGRAVDEIRIITAAN